MYETEMSSYDYNELLAYFLKITEQNGAFSENNIQRFVKDLLNNLKLWKEVEELLEKQNLMKPFKEQEMLVATVLTSMYYVIYHISFVGYNIISRYY